MDGLSLESGQICAGCEADIELTEEAILLQVIYPFVGASGLEACAIESVTGEHLYSPYFFHIDCWEEYQEELNELLTARPLTEEGSHMECSLCESTIRQWEVTGSLSFGELHYSRREPDSVPTICFDDCGVPQKLVCLSCLSRLNDEVLECWKNLSHCGECAEGTHQRCWRYGGCAEGCKEQTVYS